MGPHQAVRGIRPMGKHAEDLTLFGVCTWDVGAPNASCLAPSGSSKTPWAGMPRQ